MNTTTLRKSFYLSCFIWLFTVLVAPALFLIILFIENKSFDPTAVSSIYILWFIGAKYGLIAFVPLLFTLYWLDITKLSNSLRIILLLLSCFIFCFFPIRWMVGKKFCSDVLYYFYMYGVYCLAITWSIWLKRKKIFNKPAEPA